MKICSKCGYFSEDSNNERKCPICKGRLIEGNTQICNPSIEKEWNNGYHNDFVEERKTGEYCDRKLEKGVNGGVHYHSPPSNSDKAPKAIKYALIVFVLLPVIFNTIIPLFKLFKLGEMPDSTDPYSAYEQYLPEDFEEVEGVAYTLNDVFVYSSIDDIDPMKYVERDSYFVTSGEYFDERNNVIWIRALDSDNNVIYFCNDIYNEDISYCKDITKYRTTDRVFYYNSPYDGMSAGYFEPETILYCEFVTHNNFMYVVTQTGVAGWIYVEEDTPSDNALEYIETYSGSCFYIPGGNVNIRDFLKNNF